MALSEATFSVTVGADGTGFVSFGPGSRFFSWTVQQVSVEMATAPIGATCALRRGGPTGTLVSPIIATGDAAAGEPFIPLRTGQELTVAYTGCTPGDVGSVYVLYDDGQEV